MRQLLARSVFLMALFPALLAAGAQTWEEPSQWARIGSVQQWMDLDARFFRSFDDNRFVDRSQFRLDQKEIYAKTKLYGGGLPAVSIEEFQALGRQERQKRAEMAAGKLVFVERFLQRVQQQVQRVRENLPSGWGDRISDVKVIGQGLTSLGDAIGLDPSNPYAWHLQSYFAMCAGDEVRSRQYLEGTLEVLKYLPPEALTEMKGRVTLDLAWNQRNAGEFDQALSSLDLSEKMSGPNLETRLLRGLVYAQTGQPEKARRIASELRDVDVRRFPTNLRTTDFQPELMDPANWTKKPSSYLAAWITALTLLEEGDRELASLGFGSFAMDDHYRFGWRFWNEAGLIYEMLGRNADAIEAWNTARINRPWLRNMVYKPYDMVLGVLTGHNARVPYMLGFDRHYIAGSRLGHAASLVGKVGNAETPVTRQGWALRALNELDICQNAGIYPGQASVLQGHVYYLLGDIPSTLTELEEALGYLEKQGDEKVRAAVMKDLVAIRNNQQAGDGTSFFKQSGNSQGRWQADADPAAREQELKLRLEADPANREAVLDLARFMIRHGRPTEGKALIAHEEGLKGSVDALALSLEADRLQGETELALALVKKLEAGKSEPWNSSSLWSLVGSICLENGENEQALQAFQHALALDPENQGLRMQVRLMGQ